MRARGGRGFLLPGLLFLFAIDLVPLVYSAWLSLYDWWLLRPRSIRVHRARQLRSGSPPTRSCGEPWW